MSSLLVVRGKDVQDILNNQEEPIISLVSKAYMYQNEGKTALPQSVFLRFPDNDLNRIIGLPAYLGGDEQIAGMKWISSFPENINHGIERASAVLVLNDMETGHPAALLESSIISAKRTAASAALAASLLHTNKEEECIGLVGCGRINYEILKFLKHRFQNVTRIFLFDIFKERAEEFKNMFSKGNLMMDIMDTVDDVFKHAKLVAFATTAGKPYIDSIPYCDEKTTILNVSLRDFSPAVISKCDNVVDDVEHVLREKTSVHLTELEVHNRDFIRCPLADIISGNQPSREEGKTVIFSPFGLGVLDLAVGNYVYNRAQEKGLGIQIEDFL